MLRFSCTSLRTITPCRALDAERRLFQTTTCACGRKSLLPYDKRFGIRPSDASPIKPGGTLKLAAMLGRGDDMPQHPGIYDTEGNFHMIKEMVPEFVVPDLKDFKLKPYVSYRCSDIVQSEFTAKDLFDATFAKDLVEQYKDGKIDIKAMQKKLEEITSTTKN